MDVRSIPLTELLPPLYPVRTHADDDKMRELVRSIATKGLIHPLTVTPEDGKYRILAGHRRLIAVRGLGWQEVPCSIMDLDGRKAEDITVEENLVREDVNDLDLGYFLKHICDREGISGADVARRYGHGPRWATQYIRLTKIDDDTQVAVRDGLLAGVAALELERVDNEELRKAYTREAIVREQNITQVRQVADAYVRNKQNVDGSIERAQEVRREQRENPTVRRCEWCGRPISEMTLDTIELCRDCHYHLVKARDSEAAASE